jgi:hypothetical protein
MKITFDNILSPWWEIWGRINYFVAHLSLAQVREGEGLYNSIEDAIEHAVEFGCQK